MVSPTNPIGPAAAVAAPHSSTTTTATNNLASPTRWPSDFATSSPSDIAFSTRPQNSDSTIPTRMNGATCAATSEPRPANDPTDQNRNWSNVSTSPISTAVVNDPSIAVSAAPASASFTGVAPSRPSDPRK